MAVSKQQAESVENKKIAVIVDMLEQKIDEMLLAGQRSISISDINLGLRADVIEAVKARYSGKGWVIKFDSGYDCRDNYSWDSLIFS